MKKITPIVICMAISLSLTITVKGQFQQIGASGFYETPTTGNNIGIGNFGNNSANVLSALHIDGSALQTTTGEVFRTIGKSATATYWRMLRDVSGTPTEFGTIYNFNDNHFYIQATNGSGDIRFNTGGSTTNMTLTSAGGLGIGTTSPPANTLTFGNGSAKTIGIESTASGTAGKALTVAGGNTASGSSNVNGGNSVIQAGMGTGTGTSSILFQTGDPAASTTLQSASTKMTILSNGYVGTSKI
jgi:hypothetical protein